MARLRLVQQPQTGRFSIQVPLQGPQVLLITSNLFLVVKLHICAGNSRHLRMIRKSQMLTYLTVSRDSDHLESEKAKSVEENNGGGGQAVPMFRTCLSDLQKLALNIEGELFCFLNFERLEQK